MFDQKDHSEEDYIGNIWGWKWSFIALGFILFVLAIMFGRYTYLKSTGQYPLKVETDSSLLDIEHEILEVPRDGK